MGPYRQRHGRRLDMHIDGRRNLDRGSIGTCALRGQLRAASERPWAKEPAVWGDGRVDSHHGLQLTAFVVVVVLDTTQRACVAHAHRAARLPDDRWRVQYTFLGTRVCRDAFMTLTGLSASVLHAARTDALEDMVISCDCRDAGEQQQGRRVPRGSGTRVPMPSRAPWMATHTSRQAGRYSTTPGHFGKARGNRRRGCAGIASVEAGPQG